MLNIIFFCITLYHAETYLTILVTVRLLRWKYLSLASVKQAKINRGGFLPNTACNASWVKKST